MQVLGHRGSRRPGPENTPEAVRAALAAGADGVELDVRRTRDGRLVCIHDPVLARVPHERPGSAGELRRVVIESDAASLNLPSIDDVLDAGRGARVVLEVKNARRQPDYDGRRATSARLLSGLLERRQAAGSPTTSSSPASIRRRSSWPARRAIAPAC